MEAPELSTYINTLERAKAEKHVERHNLLCNVVSEPSILKNTQIGFRMKAIQVFLESYDYNDDDYLSESTNNLLLALINEVIAEINSQL